MNMLETLDDVTNCPEVSPAVVIVENIYEGDDIDGVHARPTTGKGKGSKGMKLPWALYKGKDNNQRILKTIV